MIYDSITVSGSLKLKQYGSGSLTLDESGDVVMDRKIYMTGISASHIHDALGYEPYNATNPSGYMSEMTYNAITASLGFTPSTNARTITINEVSYDLSADRSWTILGGVTAFNTRSGSITLTAADVTGSLGFTPYNATNPSSFATQTYVNTAVSNLVNSSPSTLDTLSELATALGNDAAFSTTVSTALGNRLRVDTASQGLSATLQGYGRTNLGLGTAATSATGDFATAAHTHTSLQVTTALGFTPYNATNPSGYTTNTGTVTGVTGTAPVISSGGTAPAISMAAASSGVNGYMTGVYATKLDGIAAGATNVTNTNQLTNGAGFITGVTNISGTAASETLGSVTNRGSSTSQNITFSNGRKGLIGVYDAAQTQAIFAMGAAYILTDGGASSTIGSLYGLAWSYNPDYGGAGNNPQSKAGLNHQLLHMQNGITTAAIGSGIWTSGNISAANFSGTSSGTNTGDQTNVSGTAGSISGFGNPTTSATANTIVYREANGYITNSYFYASGGGSERNASGMGYFAGHNSSDYYYRSYTAAAAAALLGLGTAAYQSANQSLNTSNGPTFTNIYNSGWFRNNNSNEGLYNQTTTMHWSSNTNAYWDASSTSTTVAIRFYTGGHVTNLRGFVYADSSSNIGFLTSAGGWSLRMDSSGNATATGDVTAYSDIRIKTNIETITGALDKVIALRGVYYNRTDNGDTAQKLGVIAQEVQKILPQVVNEQTDGMLSVSYGNLAGLFIEAIKEQQSQIEELKTIINGLTK